LKAFIRIAGTLLPTLIDIGVSIYVISEDLAKKFRLKVEVNDRTKVALLGEGSKVRIIGLIPNVLIVIQNFHTSESLYVMKENESVVIFKIDWMD